MLLWAPGLPVDHSFKPINLSVDHAICSTGIEQIPSHALHSTIKPPPAPCQGFKYPQSPRPMSAKPRLIAEISSQGSGILSVQINDFAALPDSLSSPFGASPSCGATHTRLLFWREVCPANLAATDCHLKEECRARVPTVHGRTVSWQRQAIDTMFLQGISGKPLLLHLARSSCALTSTCRKFVLYAESCTWTGCAHRDERGIP